MHWRRSSPGLSFPSRLISPIPCHLLGQSQVSPPFHCLGVWGQGQPVLSPPGPAGTQRILRAPGAAGPAASVPGCGAPGTGRALPERRAAERTDLRRCTLSCRHGCLAPSCRAHHGTPNKGVLALELSQDRGFPWVPPAAVGPCSSQTSGGIPGGHHRWAMGSWVGGRLGEPVPQRCWPGEHLGWERQVAAGRAHTRPAPTCAPCVLHSPRHPRVLRCQQQAGGTVLPR